MSIHFRHDNHDYKIQLTEKNSDLTVEIHGVTYSVIVQKNQLDAVKNILAPIFKEHQSFASFKELSIRINDLEGVSSAKVQTLATKILNPTPLVSTIEDKKLAVEKGLIPKIPTQAGPIQSMTIEQRMGELNIPGASVAVIDHGEITWTAGYGELAKPALIQGASTSKTVTALTIFSLIDQCQKASAKGQPSGLAGNVSIHLDTDVSTLLDEDLWHSIDPNKLLDGLSPKMTIRQLLSHTAGTNVHGFNGYLRLEALDKQIELLRDRLGHEEENASASLDSVSRLQNRLNQLEETRLKHLHQEIPSVDGILRGTGNSEQVKVVELPGTQFEYSGGGTTILQKLIEVVTGQRFEDVVQTRVFDKLDMSDSTYHPEKLALSHGHETDGTVLPGQWLICPELAAAGLWTTPTDLSKMALEIQRSFLGKDSSVLSAELAKQMLKPHTTLPGMVVGLGVFIDETPSSTYFSHGGSNPGFKCLFISNTKGQGASIMTNSDEGYALCNEIVSSIARIYGWADADKIQNLSPLLTADEVEALNRPIDMERWKATVGIYRLKNHTIEVSLLGEKFFVSVDEGDRFEMIPLTDRLGSYQSPSFGDGFIRFQKSGDSVTSLNFYGMDHIKVTTQ